VGEIDCGELRGSQSGCQSRQVNLRELPTFRPSVILEPIPLSNSSSKNCLWPVELLRSETL
jgi:hypothetical protein